MSQAIIIIIGAIAAVLFIFFCKKKYPPNIEMKVYANGLFIAALIYVLFLFNGSSTQWIFVEIGGVILFGTIAYFSIKRKLPALLALGWLLHIGWDTLLHNSVATSFVPNLYEELCIGFDLVMAGYIFFVLKSKI